MFKKVGALTLAAALTLALATPATASAPPAPPETTQVQLATGPGWVLVGEVPTDGPQEYVHDCGIISCSIYYTRSETRRINYNINLYGGGIAGLGLACGAIALMSGPAAGAVSIACGAAIITSGSFFLNAVTQAAAENHCLRMRYGPGQPSTFHNDNSRFCRN